MRFYPDEFIKKILPKGFLEKTLLTSDFAIKQTTMLALSKARVVAGDDLLQSIRGVVKRYKQKAQELKELGERSYKKQAVNGEALLKQRIKNIVVQAEVQELKDKYDGGKYRWLPSGAMEPNPEHQLLYGKVFDVGDGDAEGNMPGERYGCQCGIEFLTVDKKK